VSRALGARGLSAGGRLTPAGPTPSAVSPIAESGPAGSVGLMRILVSGASGLIGSALREELRADGHEVCTLVRREPGGVHEYEWPPDEGRLPAEAIEWADGVVTLSGAPLGRLPWTRSYRREIYESRVTATRTVARAIAAAENPPRVWVSGSATGFYGDRAGTV